MAKFITIVIVSLLNIFLVACLGENDASRVGRAYRGGNECRDFVWNPETDTVTKSRPVLVTEGTLRFDNKAHTAEHVAYLSTLGGCGVGYRVHTIELQIARVVRTADLSGVRVDVTIDNEIYEGDCEAYSIADLDGHVTNWATCYVDIDVEVLSAEDDVRIDVNFYDLPYLASAKSLFNFGIDWIDIETQKGVALGWAGDINDFE